MPSAHLRDDTDIAAAAAAALGWHSELTDKIGVTVRDGWVTLTGKAHWQYQRTAAENAVRHLRGVCGVNNEIALEPQPKAADVRERIRKELQRTVDEDVNRINVETSNGHVRLTGTVKSWTEDQAARRAAWSTPGVTDVDDLLAIG